MTGAEDQPFSLHLSYHSVHPVENGLVDGVMAVDRHLQALVPGVRWHDAFDRIPPWQFRFGPSQSVCADDHQQYCDTGDGRRWRHFEQGGAPNVSVPQSEGLHRSTTCHIR